MEDVVGEVLDDLLALGAPRDVVHQVLVRLRLPRTRLAAHDERLRLFGLDVCAVRLLGHRVRVGLGDADGLAPVRAHALVAVHGQHLERVHRDQDAPRVGVDLLGSVPLAEVVQNGRLANVEEEAVVVGGHAIGIGRHAVHRTHRTRRAPHHHRVARRALSEALHGGLHERLARALGRVLDPHRLAGFDHFLRL